VNKEAKTSFPINELAKKRWSPRAFLDKPVEKEKLISFFEQHAGQHPVAMSSHGVSSLVCFPMKPGKKYFQPSIMATRSGTSICLR
jgi:hypothetical protein